MYINNLHVKLNHCEMLHSYGDYTGLRGVLNIAVSRLRRLNQIDTRKGVGGEKRNKNRSGTYNSE